MANNNSGNQSNTNSASSTFTTSSSTTQTTVSGTNVITRSDEVAVLFTDDLENLVNITGLDLAEAFQIPYELSHDPKDIITMLHEDIAHMLRDSLITGIHMIFSDDEMDKGTNEYLVRYHVHYKVDNLNTFTSDRGIKPELIVPPKGIWRDARFSLLIDWSPSAKDRRYRIRRPDYCFDWVIEENRFDATNVICFREGQMVAGSAELVSRSELTSLEHHRDIQ